MGKLLILLLLALIAWFVVRAVLRRRKVGGTPAGGAPVAGVEDMVVCTRCGVNLPKAEALQARGRFYCSEEHRLPPD